MNFSKESLAEFFKNFIKINIQSEDEEEIYNQLFDRKLNTKEVNEIFNNFLITTSAVNFSFKLTVLYNILQQTQIEMSEKNISSN